MTQSIFLKASLSPGVNRKFRIATRIYHIIHKNKEPYRFPIIINNFNRLQWLQQQIEWLHSCGYHNIHVIDNQSTYPPLLDYYQRIPATVYRLDQNKGHEALWRTHIFQRLGKYFYAYTDPDLLPDANTPKDFMSYFLSKLNEYPQMDKIGFGLKISDIPDHYPKKQEVLEWENGLLHTQVAPGLYHAVIDTTFALYRPGMMFQRWEQTLRCGAPYQLRHMPWYVDVNNLSQEEQYYMQHASDSSSWIKTLQGEDLRYSDKKK